VLFVGDASGEKDSVARGSISHKPFNWSGVPIGPLNVSIKVPVFGS